MKIEKIERLKKSISELNESPSVIEIEQIICDFGLIYHVPDTAKLYGEFECYANKDLDELGVYQTPRQMAQCISELLKYKIESYIEIGLYSGGSYLIMTEFLKWKNKSVHAVGVDITRRYMKAETIPHIENLHIGTSADFRGHSFDLAFIDADHSYTGVRADWENVGKYARIAMFHDINNDSCPGVFKLWNEIKQEGSVMEYKYHTDGLNVHGIGLIFNRPDSV